jgi:putative ABC transport system ATP-binding protein
MKTIPGLRADGLVKRFGTGPAAIRAVDAVSLEVAPGECVAVTGASGCGKSTLLSLLAGLERADAGQVWWGAEPIAGLDEAALARLRGHRVGLVFQSYRLLPHLSALENVALPLELAGATGARERALEGLGQMGLQGRAQHRPAELSGGEQQRVALARALVAGPAVLLADEPTGSLDSRNAKRLGGLLLAAARRHKTALLLVTHDPALARLADRALPMKDGRLGRRLGRA